MIREDKDNLVAFNNIKNSAKRVNIYLAAGLDDISVRDIKGFSTEMRKKNKTGRKYIRKTVEGKLKEHIASAPGEYPANETGALINSLKYVSNGQRAEIGSNIFYSKDLIDMNRKSIIDYAKENYVKNSKIMNAYFKSGLINK